jgi:hypothetical protein
VNVHRFVELSAVIILCDDDCCFAVDMVLIFLSQWCVCVLYMCMYNKLQACSLKDNKPIIQKRVAYLGTEHEKLAEQAVGPNTSTAVSMLIDILLQKPELMCLVEHKMLPHFVSLKT